MIHKVLPDRLMIYVNQAHNIYNVYLNNISKIRTWCYLHFHNVTHVTGKK